MTSSTPKQKKFEDIVKHSDVINQVVLDAATLDELGRVDVLWMYPQINRVLGFVSKSGFWGSKKAAFKLPQIVSIGPNGVLIQGEGEPTVAAKVNQLESLIHSEVWDDEGKKVGHIIDCLFNFRSGVIVRYLLAPGRLAGLTDDIYFLPPKAIQSFGHQRVLIDADLAQTLKPYRRGLKSKLAQARERFKEEYIDEVTGELRSLAQQAQQFSKDALHSFEQLSDRLRDETTTLVEQAKDRSQSLYEQAKTSGQSFTEQLRTEGQTFTEVVQDALQRNPVQRDGPTDEPDEWPDDTSPNDAPGAPASASDSEFPPFPQVDQPIPPPGDDSHEWDDAWEDEWQDWNEEGDRPSSIPPPASSRADSSTDDPWEDWEEEERESPAHPVDVEAEPDPEFETDVRHDSEAELDSIAEQDAIAPQTVEVVAEPVTTLDEAVDGANSAGSTDSEESNSVEPKVKASNVGEAISDPWDGEAIAGREEPDPWDEDEWEETEQGQSSSPPFQPHPPAQDIPSSPPSPSDPEMPADDDDDPWI